MVLWAISRLGHVGAVSRDQLDGSDAKMYVARPFSSMYQHLPNLVEEDVCLGSDGFLEFKFLLSSGAEKDFTVGKRGSKGGSKSRETEGESEQCTPGCARDEVHVDDSGNDVPAVHRC